MKKEIKDLFPNLFSIEKPDPVLSANIGRIVMIKRTGIDFEKYGIEVEGVFVVQDCDYDNDNEEIIWKGEPSFYMIMELQKNYKGDQVYRCYKINKEDAHNDWGMPVSYDKVIFVKLIDK